MNKSKTFYENVIKGGYDVRSGVYTALDSRISMALDEYGEYRYIDGDTGALQNPKLASLSAMSDESANEDIITKALFSGLNGIKHHPVIGYYSGLYAGHVIEGDFRKNASSGGLTTWILCELLKRGEIDGVIHAHHSKKKGVLFEYGTSLSAEEIQKNSKTRYYPLEISSLIEALKKDSKRYAVVGIPSFITELRLMTREFPDLASKLPYMLGLICGHQKSAHYSNNLAWQYGIKPDNLKDIDYRFKTKEPASLYSIKLTGLVNGKTKTIIKRQDMPFGGNWGHGFFKTKFSDYTDDALNETADASLGDAWLPQYVSDSLGTNVLIVRNPTIQEIIDTGLSSGALQLDTLEPKTVIKSQSGLVHHIKDELPYRLYRDDKRGVWRPTKRVNASSSLTLLRRLIQDTREKIRNNSRLEFVDALESNVYEKFVTSLSYSIKRYNSLYKIQSLSKLTPRKVIRKIASLI